MTKLEGTLQGTVTGASAMRTRTQRAVAIVAIAIAVALLAVVTGLLKPAPAGGQTKPAPGAVEAPSTTTAVTTSTTSTPAPAPVLPAVDAVSYGPLPEQLLDVHLPTTGTGPFPVIIYLHSGGWVGGTRTAVPGVLMQQVDRAGIAVVSIDYRLTAHALDGSIVNSFPVPDTDVDRAVRFVKAHAATWNLDPTRVLLAGASAGGHLAALAAAAPGAFVDPTLPAELARVSPRVVGVIDFIGISDFTTWGAAGGWAPGLMTMFLDCPNSRVDECDPAKMADASVATHLDASAPPAFLAYGSHDGLVIPATQGLPLADAWAAARGDVRPPTASTSGVAYDLTSSGHTIDGSVVDLPALQTWIDATIADAAA